jgi:hypothetical protein
MVNKGEAGQLLRLKGRVRGAVFETDAEYIRNKYGNAGLEKITAAMHELGCELHYGDFNSMDWHPLGLRALSLLVMRDAFKWTDEDIRAMGDAAPKYSFIVKFLMKFFVAPKVAFSHAPEYWTKHYDIGRLQAVELNEEKGCAVVHLCDFEVHAIYCRYLEGFFGRLFTFMFPRSTVGIRETSCQCKGDSLHEFLVNWEKR